MARAKGSINGAFILVNLGASRHLFKKPNEGSSRKSVFQLVAKLATLALLCALWACTQKPLLTLPSKKEAQVGPVLSGTGAPKAPAALDVATREEREAAVAQTSVAETQALGETIVSLGNPAETGFWVKTPLLATKSSGRVTHKETGKSVNVTLLPLDGQGSGSQISLSAMRALGLPLTSLTSVVIFQE